MEVNDVGAIKGVIYNICITINKDLSGGDIESSIIVDESLTTDLLKKESGVVLICTLLDKILRDSNICRPENIKTLLDGIK